MRKLLIILFMIPLIGIAQHPVGVLESPQKPYFNKNIRVRDSLGVDKVLAVDTVSTNYGSRVWFKKPTSTDTSFFNYLNARSGQSVYVLTTLRPDSMVCGDDAVFDSTAVFKDTTFFYRLIAVDTIIPAGDGGVTFKNLVEFLDYVSVLAGADTSIKVSMQGGAGNDIGINVEADLAVNAEKGININGCVDGIVINKGWVSPGTRAILVNGGRDTAISARGWSNIDYVNSSKVTSSSYNSSSDLTLKRGDTLVGKFTADNIFLGYNAGRNYLAGKGSQYNIFIGHESGMNDPGPSGYNTALGYRTLYSNMGTDNTAIGANSLVGNLTGYTNTAVGKSSLQANTIGYSNSAFGYFSLYSNVTGNLNTAVGFNSGYSSVGSGNVYLGYGSGYNNTLSNRGFIGSYYHNSLLLDTTYTPFYWYEGSVPANTRIYLNGNVSISNSLYSPVIYGGILTTSDLILKATSAVGASGSDIEFYNGANNLSHSILNDGNSYFGYNIGIGSLTPFSKLAVVGSNSSNVNMFNFVNSDYNKNRATIINATDTSSLSMQFTSTGKPMMFLRSVSGLNIFTYDSSSFYKFGANAATYLLKDVVFASTLGTAGDKLDFLLVSTGTSATASGPDLFLCEDDGAGLGNGHRLGGITFQSTTSGSHSATTSSVIEALATESWTTGKAGSKLLFSVTPNATITPLVALSIENTGALTIAKNLTTQDSLTMLHEASYFRSGDSLTFASKSGWGTIFIDSAGVRLAKMQVSFDADGTPYIDEVVGKSYIYTSTTSEAGKLCFYDGGTAVRFKNSLTYGVTAKIDLHY